MAARGILWTRWGPGVSRDEGSWSKASVQTEREDPEHSEKEAEGAEGVWAGNQLLPHGSRRRHRGHNVG